MKIEVPPAPLASWEKPKKKAPAPLKSILVQAFDAGFISRIVTSMLWSGALLMIVVLGVSKSAVVAGSFGSGVGLGALLLKSQEWFAHKVLAPRREGENTKWSRLPLAVVLPLKYLFVMAALGIAVEGGVLNPPALAAGFVVGQLVIVAKVVGRFVSLRQRS
jgi:hypothetical protein